MKKKPLAKGHDIRHIVGSPDGARALAWTTPSYGAPVVHLVDIAAGTSAELPLPPPFTRVFGGAFVGDHVVVAARGGDDKQAVFAIDFVGGVVATHALPDWDSISGSVACAADGRVAVVQNRRLFLWESGALLAGRAPHVIADVPVDVHTSGRAAFAGDGALLVLASDHLVEFDASLQQRLLRFPAGIAAAGDLTCTSEAFAFLGARGDDAMFNDETTFVLNRKSGEVLFEKSEEMLLAHLTAEGHVLGVSPGVAGLKYLGRKAWTRDEETKGGYVRRRALDGTLLASLPLAIPRVDAFCAVDDALLIGSPKGVTLLQEKKSTPAKKRA